MPWYVNQNGQCVIRDDEDAAKILRSWRSDIDVDAAIQEHGKLDYSVGPVTMTMVWSEEDDRPLHRRRPFQR